MGADHATRFPLSFYVGGVGSGMCCPTWVASTPKVSVAVGRTMAGIIGWEFAWSLSHATTVT